MSTANWWARKLNAPETPSRMEPHPGYQTPGEQSYQAPQTQQPTGPRKQLRHERAAGICPDCGSDKYFAIAGAGKPRCFECGYPLVQTTSGMGGTGAGETSVPSKQTNARGTSQYHPDVIFDRIG